MAFLNVLPLISLLALPLPAGAYLDPGTGSMLFQFLIAFFVGASFAAKVYWYKVKSFFSRLFLSHKDNVKEDNNEE